MNRISSWTKLTTALGKFRYGSLAGGVPPTPLKAEWLNMVQEELANFVLNYLPSLDAKDDGQLLKAIQAFGAAYPLKATTLAGYEIGDAYTKAEIDVLASVKADSATTLAGYGVEDAYTKPEIDADMADKQAKINELSEKKQEKNRAHLAKNGWWLDSATGFLEQWGHGECGSDHTTGNLDFPIPFEQVFICFGNKITPLANDGDGNSAGAFSTSPRHFKLFNDTKLRPVTVHWRAIGLAPMP